MDKDRVIDDFVKTETHLCDNCIYNYPECSAEKIKFGNGRGNDNVIDCDMYNQAE